ncbi:NAD-dependent epimerase/dehydratase family protein [Patescibacteria group bacterium]|nr:NAD-dependent epimerase/dehydratase family protein [Patescibacteria group bacterium]MBU2219889.1 NAD-dependent epimerase/dehydratase family protein [Patescibacteria group bacterium]
MAILITGGKGFVGAGLADFLKKTGQKVVLLENNIANKKEILNFKSNEPIEAIVHLAGVISGKNRETFRQINIEGTRNITELGQKLQVKKIIFISSLRVLSSLSDPYIDSKREAEKIVVGSGLPYVILRPSLIYGPGDNKNITQLARLMKRLPVVPVFNFRWQPIFINDLVEAIVKCLVLPNSQIINMAGRETVSYKDIIDRLRAKGLKAIVINAPRFWSLLLRFFSYFPFSPLTNWQVKTLLADEIFPEYYWYDLLNIKSAPFSEGLDKLLKNL